MCVSARNARDVKDLQIGAVVSVMVDVIPARVIIVEIVKSLEAVGEWRWA